MGCSARARCGVFCTATRHVVAFSCMTWHSASIWTEGLQQQQVSLAISGGLRLGCRNAQNMARIRTRSVRLCRSHATRRLQGWRPAHNGGRQQPRAVASRGSPQLSMELWTCGSSRSPGSFSFLVLLYSFRPLRVSTFAAALLSCKRSILSGS